MGRSHPAMVIEQRGVRIATAASPTLEGALRVYLAELGIDPAMVVRMDCGQTSCFRLRDDLSREWAPDYDTMQLSSRFRLDADGRRGLEREIAVSMLLSPIPFDFPSVDEFVSAVRIRRNIVEAARKTRLAFDTEAAERPEDYWTYDEETGFTLLPGRPLIEALEKATQPEVSGRLYSFSCYRATEYVILLAIARELRDRHPELLEKLQAQWERRAIMSGQFHDVFLREFGSMEAPLPPRYYIPGDRLWFRNPDEASSDVMGYEGSWVFYLGDGLFTNFWQSDRPFDLTAKCLELYHWRHGVYRDGEGELRMDEDIVADHVARSQRDPAETAHILDRMLRLRDPKGVYAEGGCIDTSRECPRWICRGTSDMVLPPH